MTTDNKTLADAQPGGMVRLGDHDEKPPQELPELIVTRGDGIPLPDQAAGIEEFKRQCLRRIEAEYPHLSAQPSPGGQDALELLEAYDQAVEDLSVERSDGWNEDNRRPQLEADVAELRAELIAALAARQPVGQEPAFFVNRWEMEHGTASGLVAMRTGKHLGIRDFFTVPLYAAPPAQAVDLGGLREILESWKNSDYPFSYEGQCAQRALDACIADLKGWLDSQAVGDGN
ncbi:hypothetical protein B9Y75_06815 [Stenotrophomonas maltophilia]|nr:hypothetical protein B9Y75_06815 [Stenotrophomonas maltophilia]